MAVPDELQPIVLVIDDTQAQATIDRSNRAYEDYRARSVRANEQIGNSWQKQAEQAESASNRNRSTYERLFSDVERLARSTASVTQTVLSSVAKVGAAGIELVGVFRLAQLALSRTGEEAGVLKRTFESVRDTVRSVEVGSAGFRAGVGAAIDVASVIALAQATEKIAEITYQRGAQIQAQAVEAAKSHLSYENVATLNFAAQRAGVSPDFFDAAAKAAGGVDQLAQKMRDLGEVRDPVQRTAEAFKAFGDNAEQMLPFLNERLAENVQRVQEWGLVLDKVDRENISQFKRDIDSLKQSFVGLGDEVKAWSESVGTYFAKAFASIYGTLREGATLAPTVISTLSGLVGKMTGAPQIAFAEEPFDVAAAAARIRERAGVQPQSEVDLVDALRKNAPAGTKQFLAARGDQEDVLRSRAADLQKRLFVEDATSPQFGQLKPAATFPGGYSGQALALQQYVSANNRIDQIEREKKAQAELEAAQKAVAAQLQAAQLAELQGADRLRAEREIALQQYGKTKELISDINKEFDIRFRIEGARILKQDQSDRATRAQAEAARQDEQLRARTQYTVGAVLETGRIREQGAERRGQLDLQEAAAQRTTNLLALEAQTTPPPASGDRQSMRQYQEQLLADKVTLEARKVDIEKTYLEKARDLELNGLQAAYDKELGGARVLVDAKLISDRAYADRKAALDANLETERRALILRTDTEINDARVRAAIEANRLIQEDTKRLAEEQQRELESIARPAENLLHTLFTNPRGFGAQFSDTIKNALLKPIEEGLANVTARALRATIYGQTGEGGIAGNFRNLFGEQGRDQLSATNLNTSAMAALRTALVGLTAVMTAAGGQRQVPYAPSPLPQQLTGQPALTSLLSQIPHFQEGGIVDRPTVALIGEAGKEAVVPMTGNWLDALKRAIGYKGQGQWQTGPMSEGQGPLGAAAAIARSPAGLLAESFGARGLVNTIHEPQWREAERLAKQVYHRQIDRREAEHIVDIAKREFEGHVSVAIRSPEVRESLGMWQPPPQQHYQQGGIVQQTGPAIVHAGEAVLPSWLTDALRSAADNRAPGGNIAGGLIAALEGTTKAVQSLAAVMKPTAPQAASLEPRNLVTRAGGFPVNFAPTDLDDGGKSYGDFDPKTNQITVYRDSLQGGHSSNLTQILKHETVHALLKGRSPQQMDDIAGTLPGQFFDRATAGIEDAYGYRAAGAFEEVIPRLVSGESLDAMGINDKQRQGLLQQLYTGLRAHGDSGLASQFQQLSSAGDVSDLVTTGKMHDLAPLSQPGNAYSDVAANTAAIRTLTGVIAAAAGGSGRMPSLASYSSFDQIPMFPSTLPASLSLPSGPAAAAAPLSLPIAGPAAVPIHGGFAGPVAENISAAPVIGSITAPAIPPALPDLSVLGPAYSGIGGGQTISTSQPATYGGAVSGTPQTGTYPAQTPSLFSRIFGSIGGGGGGSPLGFISRIVGGPGGTSGFAGPVGGIQYNPITGGYSQSGPFDENPNSTFGFPGQSGGGLGGSLGLPSFGNFKSFLGIGTADRGGLPGVDGAPGTDLGFGTSFSSVAGSAGAGMAGMFLAKQGLMGSGAGTGMGVLEGTAGGALIGMQYGGPIGAAVGAAVGLGIGLGEMFAGVEPQWKEAERLAKQIYHVTIQQSTGQQIADVANQKYGGHVSVAIRDPQIRQMLELYSFATGQGQHFPQSATTPRPASLVESGGQLYQQATYHYGNAYTFASNLPTFGGITTGTYPNPGGAPASPQAVAGGSAAPVSAAAVIGSGPSGAAGGSGNLPSSIRFQFDGAATTALLRGEVAEVATPDYVQDQFSDAMNGSMGRQQTSALLQQSGLIIS